MTPTDAPLNQLLGIHVTAAGDGRATVVLEVDERHTNRAGIVHGGVISALCDTAMGAATTTTLAAGDTYATAQLQLQLLRSSRPDDRLECAATVLHRGSRVAAVEADVHDAATGQLVAKATSTCIIGSLDRR